VSSNIWYCTRERVKRALDSAETARNNAQVDAAISAATDQIHGLTHRVFYPEVAARYFDNELYISTVGTRLWLGKHDLVNATSITVDGVALSASDYHLCPQDGPPYSYIDLDGDSSRSWSTSQRGNMIAGTWGWWDRTDPAGTTAEALDNAETGADVTNSGVIGVGDILEVASERMVVTGKAMLATGVTIDVADSLTASNADVGITCSAALGMPVVDETIMIDAERMLVVETAGTLVVARRGWDGSVLTTHAGGTPIYAPRTLTVERGALGTTASAHDSGTAISRYVPPPLVSQYAVALAMDTLLQEGSGYARIAGSGESAQEFWGRALSGLADRVYARYGRKARMAAI
jgi:hypothetical protein